MAFKMKGWSPFKIWAPGDIAGNRARLEHELERDRRDMDRTMDLMAEESAKERKNKKKKKKDKEEESDKSESPMKNIATDNVITRSLGRVGQGMADKLK